MYHSFGQPLCHRSQLLQETAAYKNEKRVARWLIHIEVLLIHIEVLLIHTEVLLIHTKVLLILTTDRGIGTHYNRTRILKTTNII